jgi:hypothetical protein
VNEVETLRARRYVSNHTTGGEHERPSLWSFAVGHCTLRLLVVLTGLYEPSVLWEPVIMVKERDAE